MSSVSRSTTHRISRVAGARECATAHVARTGERHMDTGKAVFHSSALKNASDHAQKETASIRRALSSDSSKQDTFRKEAPQSKVEKSK